MNIYKVRNIIIYFLFCFLIAFTSQCRKQDILTHSNVTLSFSSDTILFDTLFTTIGSTTKYFKVYNSNNGKINISSIHLAQGTNSPFRINVNGDAGVLFENIEIEENDSIFIFVEVTIDPNNTNNPNNPNNNITTMKTLEAVLWEEKKFKMFNLDYFPINLFC